MEVSGNYRDTKTYKNADNQTRSKIEKYKKEYDIKSNHMYLLLLREDYRNLPKEEKERGNRPAELLVLSGIFSFLVMTANNRRDFLPYVAIYTIVAAIVYFSGILNPIARQLKNINKLLKNFPETPSLKEYLENN